MSRRRLVSEVRQCRLYTNDIPISQTEYVFKLESVHDNRVLYTYQDVSDGLTSVRSTLVRQVRVRISESRNPPALALERCERRCESIGLARQCPGCVRL